MPSLYQFTENASSWLQLANMRHGPMQCLCILPYFPINYSDETHRVLSIFYMWTTSYFSFSVIRPFLPNPAISDIQWIATIEYQYWQDSARIWHKRQITEKLD